MASVVLTVSDNVKKELDSFPWVNWSEIGREEFLKKEIFERYIKTGKVSDEDWKFCEKIDWHPVDELPLREEFVKRLEEADKGKFIKLNSVEDLFGE